MSNVLNIGWDPLQLMMRDFNGNIPEEFKHLPFTDEVNQLLLSALSSAEHVQNHYTGLDGHYRNMRYVNSADAPSPGFPNQQSACPPSTTSSQLPTSQVPNTQQMPVHTTSKHAKVPPSIQLPTNQHTGQLSPRMHPPSQIPPQLQQPVPPTQMHRGSQQPKNPPAPHTQLPPHLHQVPMQMQPLPPQQLQLQHLQQSQIPQPSQDRGVSLQAQLLQHLQQQRQQQQHITQTNVPQTSIPQANQVPGKSQSPPVTRPSSPTQVSIRPPSPGRDVSPPPQHLLPQHLQHMNQPYPPQHYAVHSQYPQMMPSHVVPPSLSTPTHLMQLQQLSTLQHLQQQQQVQAQVPEHQPPVPPQPQKTQPTAQAPVQVQQAPAQAPSSSSSSSSSSQASQFGRSVSHSPQLTEPGSPTIYQFINVKEENDPTKTKPLTEKQKNRRRASQNLASRNYRQRKKEYITTIEDRSQDLERQNEQLRRQVNQKELIISKLSKEAASGVAASSSPLDVEDLDDVGPVDSNMQEIIMRLERCITLEDENSDRETTEAKLQETLKMFYSSLQERHDRYTDQVKEIVNPCTQAKLSALDSDPVSPFDNGFTENDDIWWDSFSKDAKVTEEQATNIKEVRHDHFLEFQRLRTERRDLNKDIRDYYRFVFSSASVPTESSDQEADVKMEELVSKLNSLKQNLDDEKRLILQTHSAMSKILTPKQEAVLVTRSYNKVVRSNATIQMVTSMYEVVLKESALAKCCAPGWELL